jgi:hypothetical protein
MNAPISYRPLRGARTRKQTSQAWLRDQFLGLGVGAMNKVEAHGMLHGFDVDRLREFNETPPAPTLPRNSEVDHPTNLLCGERRVLGQRRGRSPERCDAKSHERTLARRDRRTRWFWSQGREQHVEGAA